MFDILFQNKKGKLENYTELITVGIKKLQISRIAIDKAANMIAHAIAKSEFIVQRKKGREKDHIYYMLNVKPNPNETATEFWIESVIKLLLDEECAICHMNGSMYRMESYSTDNMVMMPKRYKDVTITSGGETMRLEREFTASDVLCITSKNQKLKSYLEEIMKIYDDLAGAIAAAKKLSSVPKFTLDVPGNAPIIRRKKPDGTDETLTIDQYKMDIKRMIESDEIEILQNNANMVMQQFKIETSITVEDISKLWKTINEECALAFDIPKAVFLGEITEKADSTNEFITFAVGWVMELLNDDMNATFVGEQDYLKGERIWIDMTRYKHVDAIESASDLYKLRGIGFNFDEIRELIGWEALNTEFSQERAITKNYTEELGGDKGGDKDDEKKKEKGEERG